MTKNQWAIGLLSITILLASCNRSPFDSTRDASNGGGTGTLVDSGNFVIFSDELKSGGGAFLYPGSDGQTLSFNDTSNSISRRSVRYSWTGQDVSAPGCNPNPEHAFAGFDLMYAQTLSQYDSSSTKDGRNLSAAGYGRVTFYVRGNLSSDTVLKVEVASSGNPPGCPVPIHSPCVTLSANGTDDDPTYPCGVTKQLTGSWQPVYISLNGANVSNIKDFFKATYIFTDPPGDQAPGQGGTAYFDVIQYQP